MIQVQRGNKQLTIAETSLDQYLTMGYSQIDENGDVINPGDAVTTADIKSENTTLKSQLIKLKKENESLKSDKNKILAENKDLKEENKTLKFEIEELKKADEDTATDEKKTKK